MVVWVVEIAFGFKKLPPSQAWEEAERRSMASFADKYDLACNSGGTGDDWRKV
jgi:hypothetical protein